MKRLAFALFVVAVTFSITGGAEAARVRVVRTRGHRALVVVRTGFPIRRVGRSKHPLRTCRDFRTIAYT